MLYRLAYVDVQKLTLNDIKIGVDGEDWIFTERQKTDTETRIPLLPYIQSWNNMKDEMEAILKKLNNHDLTVTFPSIYSLLAEEMLLTAFSKDGNDILGKTYERLFRTTGNNQILAWSKCKNLSPIPSSVVKANVEIRFLDVGCRTSRIALASPKQAPKLIRYTGVEYSLVFVQMAALNLLLSGFKNAEVVLVSPKTYSLIGAYKIRPQEDKNLVWTTKTAELQGWQNYQDYLWLKKFRT